MHKTRLKKIETKLDVIERNKPKWYHMDERFLKTFEKKLDRQLRRMGF